MVQSTQKEKTMLSTREVLEFTGCNPSTLKRAITRGEILPTEKREEGNFYRKEDVLSFVEKLKARQLKHSPQSIKTKPKGKPIMQKPKPTGRPPKKEKPINADDMLSHVGEEIKEGITKAMREAGTYKPADNPLIFSAAISYQLWLKYESLAHGLDYTDIKANGEQKEHHYFGVAEDHFDRYLKTMDKLAITPAARLKITPPEPEEEIDPMEALLAGL